MPWSYPPFLIFDIRALCAPECRMSEIKNSGLDQYGAGPFKQQQFGTAGVEGVKVLRIVSINDFNSIAAYMLNWLQ